MLEGVQDRAEQRVLPLPEVLLAGCRVDEVVVGKHVFVAMVVPVFSADQQSGYVRTPCR